MPNTQSPILALPTPQFPKIHQDPSNSRFFQITKERTPEIYEALREAEIASQSTNLVEGRFVSTFHGVRAVFESLRQALAELFSGVGKFAYHATHLDLKQAFKELGHGTLGAFKMTVYSALGTACVVMGIIAPNRVYYWLMPSKDKPAIKPTQDRITSLEKTVQNLQKQIGKQPQTAQTTQLQADLQKAQEELQIARSKLDHTQNQLRAAQSNRTPAQSPSRELQQVKDELAAANAKAQKRKDLARAERAKVNKLKQQVDTLTATQSTQGGDVQQLNEELQQTKDALVAAEDNAARRKQTARDEHSKVKSLTAQVKALTAAQSGDTATLTEQLREATEKHAQAEANMLEMINQAHQVLGENALDTTPNNFLEAHQELMTQLGAQIQEKTDEHAELTQQLQDANAGKSQLEAAFLKAQQQEVYLRNQMVDLQSELTEKFTRLVDEKEQKIRELKSAKNGVENQLLDATEKLKQAQEQTPAVITSDEAATAALGRQLQAEGHRVTELTQQLQKKEVSITSIRTELQTKTQELEQLRAEQGSLKARADIIQQQFEQTNHEVTVLKRGKVRLEETLQSLGNAALATDLFTIIDKVVSGDTGVVTFPYTNQQQETYQVTVNLNDPTHRAGLINYLQSVITTLTTVAENLQTNDAGGDAASSLFEKLRDLGAGAAAGAADALFDFKTSQKQLKYTTAMGEITRCLRTHLSCNFDQYDMRITEVDKVQCILDDLSDLKNSHDALFWHMNDLLGLLFFHQQDGTESPGQQSQAFVAKLDDVCSCIADINSSPTEYQDLIASGEYQKLIAMVDKIVLLRWAGTHMHRYLNELLELALGDEYSDEITWGNFHEQFPQINDRITPALAQTSWFSLLFNQARATGGLKDLTGEDNLPNVHCIETFKDSDENALQVNYLRHACPTNSKGISDNYKAFLKAAERKNESVLSIVLLNQDPSRTNDPLLMQTEWIQQLSDLQGEQHPNFHMLLHRIEGPEFEKSGDYANMTTFAELKEVYVQAFMDESNHNYVLPQAIPEAQHQAMLEESFDQIHQLLFNGNEHFENVVGDTELDVKDIWQICIHAFFEDLDQAVMSKLNELKPDCLIAHTTTHCKDNLDRGGVVALVRMAMREGIEPKHLIALLIGNHFAMKKNKLNHHIDAGLNFIKYLSSLEEDQRRAYLGKFAGNYRLENMEVVNQVDQSAEPNLYNATTTNLLTSWLLEFETEDKEVDPNQLLDITRYLPNQIATDLTRSETKHINILGRESFDNAEDLMRHLAAQLPKCFNEELRQKIAGTLQQNIFVEISEWAKDQVFKNNLDLVPTQVVPHPSKPRPVDWINIFSHDNDIIIERQTYKQLKCQDVQSHFSEDGSPINQWEFIYKITIRINCDDPTQIQANYSIEKTPKR